MKITDAKDQNEKKKLIRVTEEIRESEKSENITSIAFPDKASPKNKKMN